MATAVATALSVSPLKVTSTKPLAAGFTIKATMKNVEVRRSYSAKLAVNVRTYIGDEPT